METQPICPSCHKTLPPGAPLGLCPECLIKSGFKTGTDPATAAAEKPRFVPPPVEEIRRLFPQLEIISLIGQGGMGAVYKARQPALDRFVALKILPPGAVGDAGFAERFNREARALARLNHPQIVAVHDFGHAGDQPYLVMEFVDGANLRQVEQAGRLTPEQALQIVPQICEALQFAHNEGVVHRDIKPENILLDKKGRVKITDFGIAKILGVTSGKVSLTGAKDVVGTPHYMAPEQVEHPQTVDHRADIYSLGVVFYEMLTGELPLGKFAPPSKKVHVDVRLDEVVLRTLEKEPELRYQQASEVKTQVETIATSPGSSGRQSAPSPDQSRLTSAAPKPQRFSRTAIVGAVWVGLFLAGLAIMAALTIPRALRFPALPLVGILILSPLWLPAVTAPFGVTILGWTAVSQIRHSAGRLYGLGLAVFDGLLFPLLALDAFIVCTLQALTGQVWKGGGYLALALLISFVFDWRIACWVWRKVNGQPASAAPATPLAPRPWWKNWRWQLPIAIVVVATLLLANISPRSDIIGQSSFPKGDSIEITSVKRSPTRMVVKGRYNLVSAKSAQLALYITSTNDIGPVPVDASQRMQISKGTGNFELIHPHPHPGFPHVNMYSPDGKPFAALYFGTKEEAAVEKNFDLGYLPPPVGSTSSGPAKVTVEEEGLVLDSLPDNLWQARVTFRNEGSNTCPAFSILYSVGPPTRLISRNTAGPIAPGQTFCEMSANFVLRTNEVEITAVIDPENILKRPAESAEWVLKATTRNAKKLRSAPNFSSVPAKVTVEPRGMYLEPLPNDVWKAHVPLRNFGGADSPRISILFYAGPPARGGRLISRNYAGPIPPGKTWCESCKPFVFETGETEVFAVIDPDNVLKRPAESAEWILKATVKTTPDTGTGKSANSSIAFGPIFERVAESNSAIDFDSGRQASLPEFKSTDQGFGGISERVAVAATWVEFQKMDAVYTDHFTAFGMIVKALRNEDWREMSPARLSEVIQLVHPESPPVALLNPSSAGPMTYAFQTREGGQGILQTLAFNDNPRGVKIRYKMLQSDKVATKRQRFVPQAGMADKTSWSVLDKPSDLNPSGWAVTAHMSLGGVALVRLPGEEEDFCRIKLADGNDDQITLRIEGIGEKNVLTVRLLRDQRAEILMNDRGYRVAFPSVFVAADQPDSSPLALVVVTRAEPVLSGPVTARATETIDLGGGIKMEFVLIQAGSFKMGADFADEAPVHNVTISKPFYLGKYEVTQQQWEAIMESNPSQFKGPKLPVENVSWNDCQDFLKQLQKKTGRKFALPSEAQWEFVPAAPPATVSATATSI